MADENELIDRCLGGSQDAFAELVDRHKALVFSIIDRVVQDPTATEDLAQEVFLRVFRGLPRFRRQAKLSTWIYGITTRVCLEQLRRTGHSGQHVSLDADAAENFCVKDLLSQSDPAFHRVDVSRDINAWLRRLPPHYRLSVTLFYFQDRSYRQVADVMDIPIGTVKTYLFRARELLRKWALEEGTAIE